MSESTANTTDAFRSSTTLQLWFTYLNRLGHAVFDHF